MHLVVVYTTRLEECRVFYASLGLGLVPEQHGSGPRHYAAELVDGGVFELYPAPSPERATGRLRLGFTLDAGIAGRPPGRGIHTDPDGRTVEVTVRE